MNHGRRPFFKLCGAGVAGATAASLGFAPSVALATQPRQYKLLRAKETRNNCTYCSVGCGMLMYSLGDGAKNAKAKMRGIRTTRSAAARCAPRARARWTTSTPTSA